MLQRVKGIAGFGGLGQFYELRAGFGVFLDEDAEGAVLCAAGELEIDHFEVVRGRDAVCDCPDLIDLESHI